MFIPCKQRGHSRWYRLGITGERPQRGRADGVGSYGVPHHLYQRVAILCRLMEFGC